MPEHLWAPWRLEYVRQADEAPGCIFCAAADGDDEDTLVVARGTLGFALLNRYPYASGHLMVAPMRHTGDFVSLDRDEAAEIHGLASKAIGALTQVYAPHGFNLGWNLGRVAGAGILDHVHQHVVPRWGGDTNFMPVLADTRVMNQTLADSYTTVREAF